MKDFKKLIVWQKSMDLFLDVHKMSRRMPAEERYEIGSQIRRSAFSIPANIAEGSAKNSNAHYRQFLETSLGSAYETETALIAMSLLYEPLKVEIDELLERINEIQKMLMAFINKLK
jgi:four helix bundle protein